MITAYKITFMKWDNKETTRESYYYANYNTAIHKAKDFIFEAYKAEYKEKVNCGKCWIQEVDMQNPTRFDLIQLKNANMTFYEFLENETFKNFELILANTGEFSCYQHRVLISKIRIWEG